MELSPRERLVLGLFANGLKDKEISKQTGTSPRTVQQQRYSAYKKLGIRSRKEAKAWVEGQTNAS